MPYHIVSTKRKQRGSSLQFIVRSNTTDEKVVKEVIDDNVYQKPRKGFTIDLASNWLDVGSNIGTFAVWALSHGMVRRVVSIEPERENFNLLKKNIQLNKENGNLGEKDKCICHRGVIVPKNSKEEKNGSSNLYLCNGTYNKYRHSVYPRRGRTKVKVPAFSLEEILTRYSWIDGIKLDIEGSEIPILETIPLHYLKNIKALVFEYTFDVDPSIPRFLRIINRFRSIFDTIHYTKVKENELEYKYYPPCTNVYMWNSKLT